MKRLITVIGILLTLLAGPSWAVEPINLALAPAILGGAGAGAAAACPLYGPELATTANATDDDGGGEADATTGWTNFNCNTFDSVDTGTPKAGTYHLIATSVDNGDGFYRTLSGLDASTVYKVSFWYKHDGTDSATWSCGMGGGGTARNYSPQNIFATATDYAQYSAYTLYNAQQDVVACTENNAGNNGTIYVDKFSLTTATPCYGSELYTSSNAANIASESDATTGWSATDGDSAVASEETNSPHNGSSHIAISTTGANGGASQDIGGEFTLGVGTKYFVRFWARNDSTNNFFCMLDGSATGATYVGGNVLVGSGTYAEYGWGITYATASHRYLKCVEANVGNTGTVYIDGISIKEIVSE